LSEKYPILPRIGALADQLGVDAYVIGGLVRDALMGRDAKKDVDVVVIGSGIQLATALKDDLGKKAKLTVYKNFGTAAIHWEGQEIEFVGARKESYRKDSRKPLVEDGSLQDDQNRRDFTINAMAIALNRHKEGQWLDPFGGADDLKNGLIRTPLDPEQTFSDDPLRIMRAIRFASQLNFDIEAATFQAIVQMKDRLSIVSQERITDELNKIILSRKPSYGFKLLFSSGILEMIFPEMSRLQGVKTIRGKSHKDNFYHTLQVLDNTADNTQNLWLRWAAILHDIAKPATQRFHEKAGWTFHGHEDLGAKWVPGIFRRLKLPMNEPMKYVQKLVKLHLRPISLVDDGVTDSAVRRLLYETGEDIEDLMLLCRADITSKNNDKVRKYLSNFLKVEKKMEEVEQKDQMRNFKLPVTGEDIMSVFGLEPSRIVGEIKNEIREAILEGDIPNEREPAVALMMKIAAQKGIHPKSTE